MTQFTVVIPTRERCDTLRSTLQTCVTQDYDNLTILVSDNASQDATPEAVQSFSDPRIRYVRSAQRLSMASNWEFALSHVEDGFVIVLGDDDGMLPHSIRELAELLEETRVDAISWDQAVYTWPSCKGGKVPNRLRQTLSRSHEVRDAQKDLADVIAYRRLFKLLPSLYWGAVHRNVLRRATPSNGRFFHCVNPDIYSCVASTSCLDRFVVADGPYSVRGLSAHSTGMSFTLGDTSKSSTVGTFWKEVDLPVHPKVAMVPSPVVYLTEAYEQVRDHVPGVSLPSPDYAAMFHGAMEEIATSQAEAAYVLVRDAVLDIGKKHGLEDAARKAVEKFPFAGQDHRESPAGVNVLRNTITIDTTDFKIVDIAGACQLSYDTLRLYEAGYFSPKGLTVSMAKRVIDRLDRRIGRLRS
jgi:glycosyltransferase involved in cell wall biosynthesis